MSTPHRQEKSPDDAWCSCGQFWPCSTLEVPKFGRGCGGSWGEDRQRGEEAPEAVVTFTTGATRSAETAYDPEGFLSPVALTAYCEYMTKHRVQADGKLRDSDNWTRGMPTSRAFRSITRHFFDMWLIKRGAKPHSPDCTRIEDALCAIIFNAMLLLKNYTEGTHYEVEREDSATKTRQ